jgi:hypothetical protein
MRRYQKHLTASAASAALLAALGAAMAQQTPQPQGGPDSGMSNNERRTGIENNTNNSYKTWPETLDLSAPKSTTHGATARASGTQSMAQGGTSSSNPGAAPSGSGSAGHAGAVAMRAPRSDRN